VEFFGSIQWMHLIHAFILLIFGYAFSRWLSNAFERSMNSRFSRHQTMIARRLIFYGLFILFIISSLHQLGFELGVILGAAGIFTVAIGFASQTAASNLISGIFLLFDKPFKVGDLIEVNGFTGNIESIDLLSTKITTPDNTLVRMPNETRIKSAISNLSYYKTRRGEVLIGVAYESNVDLIKGLLIQIAVQHQQVLKKPEPSVIINSFADSAIELRLTFWTKADDVSSVRNQMRELVKQTFDKEKVDIPYPQITIHKADGAGT